MEPFLHIVAKQIFHKYSEILHEVYVIFPNRRAGLFFNTHLAELSDIPVWSPVSLTINEFITKLSGLQVSDQLSLIFDLYEVYKKEKKTTEPFDEFYFWGEMLLRDFNDIDKFLVDAKKIFINLDALKVIDTKFDFLTPEQVKIIKQFWKNFQPDRYSSHQNYFIRIWAILDSIYHNLTLRLKEKGKAYEGMIYREVAEKIQQGKEIVLPCKKVLLVGFNALNKCEEVLFDYLKNKGLAEFYWDYDNYYVNNNMHEAGHFIRKNLKKYPQKELITSHDNIKQPGKTIDVISVPNDAGQTKLLHKLISGNTKNNLSDTAIILGDERLLIPVFYALPQHIKDVNITMGFPVKESTVYSLLEHLIQLQKGIKNTSGGTVLFYHKHVISILKHPLVYEHQPQEIDQLIQKIQINNIIYISGREIIQHELTDKIFRSITDCSSFSDYFLELLYLIFQQFNDLDNQSKKMYKLEREFIYSVYITINRLKDILDLQSNRIKLDTYLILLKKMLQHQSVPFIGEPLSGLQIMGILETRNLDFKNVIILSVNENIIPRTGISPSFIPYNLRKAYDLPVMENHDSMYAYYFYRVLQRAEHITLIYNTHTDGYQSGEMSRYIRQLKIDKDFTISEKTLVSQIKGIKSKEITVEKTDNIMQQLGQFYASSNNPRYLSPSAINTYLDCSLKFYYRYLADIHEKKIVAEEIDPVIFGNILHKCINIIYGHLIDKEINQEVLQNIIAKPDKINLALDTAIHEEYLTHETADINYISGKNTIIREVIRKYIIQIIQTDIRYTPMRIVSLEKDYQSRISINSYDNTGIILGGKIDRIDHIVEGIRIIDYKTGNADYSFRAIPDLFSREKEDRKKEILQVLLYAYIYSENIDVQNMVIPGLYTIKELFDEEFDYKLTCNRKVLSDFEPLKALLEDELKHLISEIFDKKIPFAQVENKKICQICPYALICHRE